MKDYKDYIDSMGNIEEPEITLDYRDLITFNAEERKKTKERLRRAFLGEVVVEEALDDEEADEVVDVAPEEAEAVEEVEKVEDVEKKKEEDKSLPVAAAIALGTIAIGGAAVRTFFRKKKRRDD